MSMPLSSHHDLDCRCCSSVGIQCRHGVSCENSANLDCPLGHQSLVTDSLRSEALVTNFLAQNHRSFAS